MVRRAPPTTPEEAEAIEAARAMAMRFTADALRTLHDEKCSSPEGRMKLRDALKLLVIATQTIDGEISRVIKLAEFLLKVVDSAEKATAIRDDNLQHAQDQAIRSLERALANLTPPTTTQGSSP